MREFIVRGLPDDFEAEWLRDLIADELYWGEELELPDLVVEPWEDV